MEAINSLPKSSSAISTPKGFSFERATVAASSPKRTLSDVVLLCLGLNPKGGVLPSSETTF
jgi:hypothetical protein